ncbi:hypothetical protein SAMN05216203_0011 [Marinobacter daqiaonensis]|uniref:Lipoprotein n=1 Tax=Marinobacter daqiaonensis TaxID=650891 RepID=A0A1I6GF18_9GAMM|nr:hypothetical protein [Marinobacter daqiaonensis]SFR40769.1 hypothetical protein SAMN05216203_0011 [Marinobacter daqiaonensis]
MKKAIAVSIVVLALAGCENRTIWDSQGKVKEATTDREVWDSKGKLGDGERKIWNDREGKPVIR